MPIGPFGEILGTTGTLEHVTESMQKYKSKVIAPRNPKLLKGEQQQFKVCAIHNWFDVSQIFELRL